jgi:hypothetical protein
MSCVKVKSLAGREREICDGKVTPLKIETLPQSTFAELEKEVGAGIGDVVKVLATPIAAMVGKTNCSSCEGKRLSLNAIGNLIHKHGIVKTGGILNELFQMQDKEQIAVKLKEHLDAR